jgi:hypothetical protein
MNWRTVLYWYISLNVLHTVWLCRCKLVISVVVRGYNLVYKHITDSLFVLRSTDISMTRDMEIMKNAVFWDVTTCRYCVNRCFGGTYRPHFQGREIRERGTNVSRWLQTVNRRSSETSLHTRSARRHIPEDGILHSHRRENLKSYMEIMFKNT